MCQATEGRGRLRLTPIAGAVFALLSVSAHALPSGDQVLIPGSATVNSAGNQMTVTQNSQNAVINWQSFNIGAGESVQFVQPNTSAIALNRVLGSDPSRILGKLDANGQVWLLNPNGLLFGSSAQVNVGGLVASTLDIGNDDFLAGRRTFSGSGGAVTNQGTIRAGYAALLGGQVANEGTIIARMGTVALAAGNQVTLNFDGDQLLNVQVDRGTLDALVQNKQLIQADGGTVLMTAKAADSLASAAVNNTGVIEARTLENRNGVIKLIADMRTGTTQVAGTLDASAPNGGDGGLIETSAAHVKIADGTRVTTLAPNGRAGTWLIDPQDYTIAASGGDITGATLSSILGSGNVTILSAAGGTAGNGDIFVNDAVTWSANKLTLSAIRNIGINANLNGSGTAKLALEYGQGAVAAGNTSNYYVSNGAKVSLPAGANFSTKLGSDGATTNWTVITDLGIAGDATVAPATMTLQGMNTGLAGNYVLGADINAGATSTWNSNAGFTPVGKPATMFTGKFDGLGHTISGLTINLSGGNFLDYGMFGTTNNAVLQNVGLLNVNIQGGANGVTGALAGAIRGTTAVRNVYVDGGSVSTATQTVGGLVGSNLNTSTISYSYTDVSVAAGLGGGSTQAHAGGLVGINSSTISDSYATGSVSAPTGNLGSKYVGGLVGRQISGSVSNSYATGAVSGNNTLGGLVGLVGGGSAPTSSYWDKTTTGQNNSVGGGTAGGTGLTTGEWATLGPLATGAWSAADWVAGNPYPGIKRLPYITVAASASQTYGSAATVGIASILDQTGADASARLNAGGLSWTALTNTTTPAGTTSAVNGSGATATGYQVLYTGSVTVAKAPLTVTADNAAKPYDGVAYNGGNGVAYNGFVNGETSAVLGGTLAYGGSSQGAVNAGSYTITPSGLTSGNYTISYADGALIVNKAPLAITANNAAKTYDGLAYNDGNGVAYNGFVSGETSAVLGGTLAYGGSSQGAVNAGSYTITPSGLTSGNYTISYADGALAVNKAALTVTANNASKTYDGQAYSGSNGVAYNGFVNGETSAVLGGTLAYGGSSQGAVNAGSYAITPSGLTSGNYTISYADGALAVNKAPLTVTANNASKTYDGQAYSGGNGVNYTGLVNGETSAALSGALAYGGSSQGAVNVGSYAITPAGLTSNNYAISYADGALTVNKAPLTVAANAASKTYDGLPYLGGNGVAYNGLANGDTPSVLSGTLTYGGSAQGATNPGQYLIKPVGLSSANYVLSYQDAPLTIALSPAPTAAGARADAYPAAIATAQSVATRSEPPGRSTSAEEVLRTRIDIAQCGLKLPASLADHCQ